MNKALRYIKDLNRKPVPKAYDRALKYIISSGVCHNDFIKVQVPNLLDTLKTAKYY